MAINHRMDSVYRLFTKAIRQRMGSYAGQTLIAMGLNLDFLYDKREDGKIGIYNTIAALFITGLWIGLTYYMIKDYLL